MTDMTVANTILAQLGGNKFRVMTGAKNFIGEENALSFSLPGGGGFTTDGINKVKVTLTAMDDYTVEFFRCRKQKGVMTFKSVAMVEGIYADVLQDVFTRYTGLRTSL